MDASDAVHPTDQTLQYYGLGKLDDHLFQKVTRHLEACPPCQSRVSELSSDSFLGRLRQAQGHLEEPVAGPPRKGDAPKQPGTTAASGSSDVATTLPRELVDNPDYEIVRELGRGGMGVVYLVHNRLMGRHEAIKVIGRQLMEKQIVLDRFLREIRSVARLRHPNVVAAYSATRMGESIVYAMEYVDGLDLARLVKSKGALPVTHACYFTHQVALGLEHAHEQGIVHRDIKPGNLILSRSGERPIVKILDFGLTKAAGDDGPDTSLTREGQMLGTPDYIAPEQTLDAQSVDIRADIYSLGCSLYYLLSGRPPFRGGSLYEVLQAHHSTEATALNLLRPEVPVELAGLVAKMMAKNPQHRFQTPAEAARALTPFFKKRHATSLMPEPKPEFSVGIQANPGSKRSSTPSIPTEPSAHQVPSQAAPRQQPAPAAADSGWEGLIELGEPESLSNSTQTISNPAPMARALWPSIAITVLICGSIVVVAASALFSTTKETAAPDRVSGGVRARSGNRPTEKVDRETESPKPPLPADVANLPGSSPVAESPNDLHRPAPDVNADKADVAAKVALNRSASTIPRPPPAAKAVSADEPTVVDVRRINVFTGIKSLLDPSSVRPAASFWPSLAPDNLGNWQIGDPDHITMNEKGLYLEAGPHGNLLLTQDATFRKCILTITLAAKEGTDAFLALRACRGPQVWQAITARVSERNGKIRVGPPATNFQTSETGAGHKEFLPGKAFGVKFDIDEKNIARVAMKGERTAFARVERTPANYETGAVGIFVRSGTVMIERLDIQDR
jgi:serine/threonine protein kinase